MADSLPMYDRRALALATSRHGVVARWELRRAGVTPDEISGLVRSRHWEAVTSTVLRRVGSPHTSAQRVVIAVLDGGPGRVLSHLSSSRWWGATGCPLEPFHLTGTGSSRRRSELAVHHQVRRLPPQWACELRGVPIVRPELCALQLFAVCNERRATRLVDAMWSRRLCSGPSIARFVDDMGRRGRNGTAGLRRYLEVRGCGYVPPASGLESRAVEILEDAGITVRRQVDVGSEEAWTGRVDMLVDDQPVVVEIQSERFHTALCDREVDLDRRKRLEAAGFVWVEIWDDEVWSRPREVVTKVRSAIATLCHPTPFCPAPQAR